MQSARRARQILAKIDFSRQISEKNTHIPNFVKIHPVGPELFHVDGRGDRQKLRHDKAYSRASKFCKKKST